MELSPHSLSRLSFFDSQASDLWSVAVTGDYRADCATGRIIADDLVADIRSTGGFSLLGQVAQAIAIKGSQGGVEIGFWHRIAEHLA